MADVKKEPRKRKPSTHPPYVEMIKEAITTLKERNGSSVPAIKKALSSKHTTLPAGWEKVLNLQLKKLAESNKLVKVKGSFKLGEELKKKAPAKKVAKKPAAEKAVKAKPAVAKAKKPAAEKKPKAEKKKTPAKPKAEKKTPAKPKAEKKKAPAKPKAAVPKPKKVTKPKAAPKAKKPVAKKAKVAKPTSAKKAAPKKAKAPEA